MSHRKYPRNPYGPYTKMDRKMMFEETLREYEREIMIRDEKIVELETENAQLHLQLVKLMSQLQKSHNKIIYLTNRLSDCSKDKGSLKKAIFSLYTNFLKLQDDYDAMRIMVESLPDQMREYCHMTMRLLETECLRITTTPTVDVPALQKALAKKDKAIARLSQQLDHEKERRRVLHNVVMELRGNIRVHCRVRPVFKLDNMSQSQSSAESEAPPTDSVITALDKDSLEVATNKGERVFEYERVYSGGSTQEEIFDDVKPLITSLLDGYNVCIMAYGQTGTGKTHTMVGSHDNNLCNITTEPHPDEGIIPRAVRQLYSLIDDKPTGMHQVEISVLEIYNNEIRDLLAPPPPSPSRSKNKSPESRGSKSKGLTVNIQQARYDVVMGADGAMHVPGLTALPVGDPNAMMARIQEALERRCEATTLMNEHSSRSHLIVMVTVSIDTSLDKHAVNDNNANNSGDKKYLTNGAVSPSVRSSKSGIPLRSQKSQNGSRSSGSRSPGTQSPSPKRPTPPSSPRSSPRQATNDNMCIETRVKLQLVDLAGSECAAASGATGQQLREANSINKSLCALSDVLTALANGQNHVPYRNSRLTHFLQDSIGGDAKLLLNLCVSPMAEQLTESLQTLAFGQRARQITRGTIRRRSSSAPNCNVIGAGGGGGSPRSSPPPQSPQPLRNRSASLKTLTYGIEPSRSSFYI